MEDNVHPVPVSIEDLNEFIQNHLFYNEYTFFYGELDTEYETGSRSKFILSIKLSSPHRKDLKLKIATGLTSPFGVPKFNLWEQFKSTLKGMNLVPKPRTTTTKGNTMKQEVTPVILNSTHSVLANQSVSLDFLSITEKGFAIKVSDNINEYSGTLFFDEHTKEDVVNAINDLFEQIQKGINKAAQKEIKSLDDLARFVEQHEFKLLSNKGYKGILVARYVSHEMLKTARFLEVGIQVTEPSSGEKYTFTLLNLPVNRYVQAKGESEIDGLHQTVIDRFKDLGLVAISEDGEEVDLCL